MNYRSEIFYEALSCTLLGATAALGTVILPGETGTGSQGSVMRCLGPSHWLGVCAVKIFLTLVLLNKLRCRVLFKFQPFRLLVPDC